MDHYIKQGQIRGRLCTYKETRNGLVGADYSSKLSPYMATGDYFCTLTCIYSTIYRFYDTVDGLSHIISLTLNLNYWNHNAELIFLYSTTGTVTARSIYAEVKAFEQQSGIANENTYWLIFELLWRDYMKFYGMKHGRDMFMLGGVQGEVGR